ncbi:MAG: hypothetical protein AABN34_16265 [Acidobacteriota bacterium]
MTYTLVMDRDGIKFMNEVNKYINGGWEPLGGVAISKVYFQEQDLFEEFYCQAMIKR